jgi:hypothetical protein
VRQLRGFVLAVLLAAAQGSAWVHASVVSHVTCLEHGESVHAAEGRADVPGQGVGPDLSRALRADLGAAGGHDHCDGGALLRWRDVSLVVPHGTIPLPQVTPSAALLPAPPAVLRGASYLVAPKTSPPRSAV